MPDTPTLSDMMRASRILNDHHARYCAGFYGSTIGGRYFKARVYSGNLEVSPDMGETWRVVPFPFRFHDHNGRPIVV